MNRTIVIAATLSCLASLAQAQTAAPCTIVSPHTVCVVTVMNSSMATDNIGPACAYFQLGSSTWYALDATDANYAGALSIVQQSYSLGDVAGPFSAKYVAAVPGPTPPKKCDGTTSLASEVQLGTAQ